jgi:hypothetical protein
VGQRRVGIVDRLVLADDATQLLGELAGAGLQRRVFQHFAGLDRVGGSEEDQERQQRRDPSPHGGEDVRP